MSLIMVRMKMASSQTSTVWFTDFLPLASDDRREQGVHVEQDEVLIRADPHRLDQAGIDSWKLSPLDHRGSGNFEEVQDLPDTEPVVAPPHFQDDNGALIGGTPFLLK